MPDTNEVRALRDGRYESIVDLIKQGMLGTYAKYDRNYGISVEFRNKTSLYRVAVMGHELRFNFQFPASKYEATEKYVGKTAVFDYEIILVQVSSGSKVLEVPLILTPVNDRASDLVRKIAARLRELPAHSTLTTTRIITVAQAP